MAIIKLKKGFDLRLEGQIGDGAVPQPAAASATFAVVPDDFEGIVPRMDVRPGDKVSAGQPLYHDKNHEAIKVTSPVAGTVKEVRRGERRKILAVVIEPDGTDRAVTLDVKRPTLELLLDSGLWVMMRQRPYDVVPNPDARPRDIVVTAFDSAPLATRLHSLDDEQARAAAAAVKALKSLTDGDVMLGIAPDQDIAIEGAVTNTFAGPHPAGNAGVQLANVKPINKGEVVWTLSLDTLLRIGRLVTTGKVDYNTTVAVCGPMVTEPKLVKATIGATLESILGDNIKAGGVEPRIIAGNVLSGVKVERDGWLQAPYTLLSVIAENDEPDEFMGWAALNPKRFSIYRLFTTWLAGKRGKPASLDARIKGGERAIVRLDEYDDMLPMDIYCEFLIKAIIARDIEKMENLGVYEIAPEDFALAEFADTSKLELQRIVREGLNWLRGEME